MIALVLLLACVVVIISGGSLVKKGQMSPLLYRVLAIGMGLAAVVAAALQIRNMP